MTDERLDNEQAIDIIWFRVNEALDNTDHDKPWGENYFLLKNALSDILAIIEATGRRF